MQDATHKEVVVRWPLLLLGPVPGGGWRALVGRGAARFESSSWRVVPLSPRRVLAELAAGPKDIDRFLNAVLGLAEPGSEPAPERLLHALERGDVVIVEPLASRWFRPTRPYAAKPAVAKPRAPTTPVPAPKGTGRERVGWLEVALVDDSGAPYAGDALVAFGAEELRLAGCRTCRRVTGPAGPYSGFRLSVADAFT